MKHIIYPLTILIIIFLPLTISACWEEIPAGLKTIVRGQVIDSVKDKSLEGVKVIVSQCQHSFYGLNCGDLIDSVRTNHLGQYDLEFITAGMAHAYEVSVWSDENFIYASRDTVRAGELNLVNLYARELNVLKIEAHIQSNSVSPVRLITAGNNIVTINKVTRDTVIYGKVIPMALNILEFEVFDTTIHEVNNSRISKDEVEIGLSDTTNLIKEIIDPKGWPQRK